MASFAKRPSANLRVDQKSWCRARQASGASWAGQALAQLAGVCGLFQLLEPTQREPPAVRRRPRAVTCREMEEPGGAQNIPLSWPVHLGQWPGRRTLHTLAVTTARPSMPCRRPYSTSGCPTCRAGSSAPRSQLETVQLYPGPLTLGRHPGCAEALPESRTEGTAGTSFVCAHPPHRCRRTALPPSAIGAVCTPPRPSQRRSWLLDELLPPTGSSNELAQRRVRRSVITAITRSTDHAPAYSVWATARQPGPRVHAGAG